MPRDDDKSLGDEATLEGGNPTPADERSLGDRSTFGGGEGFSQSGLPDHDMEALFAMAMSHPVEGESDDICRASDYQND